MHTIMGCFFWIRSETKARAYHFVETALIDYEKEMSRIQNEMKDVLAKEKESQKMLEESFKGIGYDID